MLPSCTCCSLLLAALQDCLEVCYTGLELINETQRINSSRMNCVHCAFVHFSDKCNYTMIKMLGGGGGGGASA